ncbi:MAG: DUF1285 domain-containing protein [Candidatus Binatia bacterium]
MPGAGFFPIAASQLRFGSDGRWYADDEPVTHARLARFFTRYLRRKASGGYEIWVDERYHADVEIADTPYVVVSVSAPPSAAETCSSSSGSGFTLLINDETTEPLDPTTLRVGAANVLYCRIKGGTEGARFLRPAYYHLAHFIEEIGDGHFWLRCGTAAHPIATH